MLRSTRRLTLTDVGRRYVADVRAILARVGEIEREAAGEYVETTGRLVVSAPRMFGRLHVLPIVERFLGDHPGITIDLQLTDANVDLTAGVADLAVRIGPLPDSGLIATQVGTMRQVIAVSPKLFERFSIPKQPGELSILPLIALDMPMPPDGSGSIACTAATVNRTRLVVSSAEAAVDAAIAGIGAVRLLHYQVADAVKSGQLTLLLEPFEAKAAPVHVLHAPLTQLPQKMRRFLDAASAGLRTALDGLSGQ